MPPDNNLWNGAASLLIVAAHPDDETIGFGGQLPPERGVTILHVTDGAPPSHPDRRAYARKRREESLAAAAIAGISDDACITLGLVDQESSFHLVELARELARIMARLNPDAVLTHAYEGGHPDHDSAAFAVQQARRILLGLGRKPPRLIEFTSYHRHPVSGEMDIGAFLPFPGTRPVTVVLDQERQESKRRMMACYASQAGMLAQFPTDREAFRLSPAYDFSMPPHTGLLFYEQFPWGVNGGEWRELARGAQERLAS